jgi:hypothetical protein
MWKHELTSGRIVAEKWLADSIEKLNHCILINNSQIQLIIKWKVKKEFITQTSNDGSDNLAVENFLGVLNIIPFLQVAPYVVQDHLHHSSSSLTLSGSSDR